MAADAPASASRSSRGLDRSRGPDGAGDGEVADRATAGERDVVVVTHPHAHVRDADLSGHERDTLVLTAEERRWGRRRVTTTGGRTLALALPTGTTLTPGEILHVGPDWYLIVEGAPEPVLAVTPASGEEALRIAFEVGNRHFTLALDGERLLVPDDRAMDQLLTWLGVPFERAQAVFVPIGRGHRHDA
jgi:urease accessory protein